LPKRLSGQLVTCNLCPTSLSEAVNNIQRTAPDFIRQHPELPWAQMRAMRNVMIHEYFFVDLGTVWTTVKDDLPKLKQQVDRLLIDLKPDREP
jgi:uncharacterized protein with HEPN domain